MEAEADGGGGARCEAEAHTHGGAVESRPAARVPGASPSRESGCAGAAPARSPKWARRAAGAMLAKMRAAGMLPAKSTGAKSPAAAATAQPASAPRAGAAPLTAGPPAQRPAQQPRAASQPAPALATPDRGRPRSTGAVRMMVGQEVTSAGGVRRFASPTKRRMPDDAETVRAVGIGVALEEHRQYGQLPAVRSIDPHAAAGLNGNVQVGDKIETIDGAEVRYMDSNDVARQLLGPEDSEVALGLIRANRRGEEERVTATFVRTAALDQRAEMHIPDSEFGALDQGINLADVLANMRASTASNPTESFLGAEVPRTPSSAFPGGQTPTRRSTATSVPRSQAPSVGAPPSEQKSARRASMPRSPAPSMPAATPSEPKIAPYGPGSFGSFKGPPDQVDEAVASNAMRDAEAEDDTDAGAGDDTDAGAGDNTDAGAGDDALAAELRFRDVGEMRPETGRELKHPELSDALQQGQTEFTKEEWQAFGLGDLYQNDFIKVAGGGGILGLSARYFKPAPPKRNLWGKLRCVPASLSAQTVQSVRACMDSVLAGMHSMRA